MDSKYMERALELAALGREWVSPNPMVGCVIVYQDTIIGEGYHQKYGQAHAEVNAINSVQDKSLLPEATVYVTLEPCAHYGKTPPCAELLIKHGMKKVIICNTDPFPKVDGRGINMLKEAGIEVEIGLMQEEGRRLNKRFFKAHETGLPYIILKWAETADGFIAHESGKPLAISNSLTNIQVHQWRAEEDAILVGKNTVRSDNPRLNVRYGVEGKQPVRIVLDSELSLNNNFYVFDGSQATYIVNKHIDKKQDNVSYLKAKNLRDALHLLKEKGIHSILVEGGTAVHQSFITDGLFDEIRVIKSDINLHKGITAPSLPKGIKLEKTAEILNDKIFYYH